MSTKQRKYPAQLFVLEEGNTRQEKYLSPYKSADAVAVAGASVEVAIYKFDRMAKIQTKVEIK